ncbi:DUF4349 domain-containing protein [Candidatus Microgenomates bacterium]|nr:DUF4349 domain-containing protein [Candidatus Microgenomates bacterium]
MNWVKKNKLTTVLIIIVLYFLFKSLVTSFFGVNITGSRQMIPVPAYEKVSFGEISAPSLDSGRGGMVPPMESSYPPSEREERIVVEESSMSLVVSEVQETANKVTDKAKAVGGFMVNSSLNHPEEAPFATVVIRVPADKFRDTLEYFRTLAVKVSSENIRGTDVTDQYVDIEARLATLEKTKAKFESIMDQAIEINDILQIQRELINLQSQIDDLKGKEKYLEQTAKLAKITVYLSSDEFALPYTPATPFRPSVIFKLAVRSLILTLRGLASRLIWIAVYSVIWLPIILIILFIKKRKGKSNKILPPQIKA